MKLINVLILSCGSRNKLVEYFMDRKNGFGRVITTDCNDFAPALYKSDKYYIVPKYHESGYFEAIVQICKAENISLVIPLQEEELLIIAKNKERLEGAVEKKILIAVSSFHTVALCKDKLELYNFLYNNGIPCVNTNSAVEFEKIFRASQSVVIKPRKGAGSVNTNIVSSRELGNALISNTKEELIVQPFIKGIEYGVDAYRDFISRDIISIFIKQKIRMRSGETEKSISVINEQIDKLVRDAIIAIDAVGQLDIDVIQDGKDYYILEINPRFGGGYPHAYECGINFPKFLYNNAVNLVNEPLNIQYKEGVKCMKYSDVITIQ